MTSPLATQARTDSQPNVAAPPDATEVFGWTHQGHDLASRTFAGTVRDAAVHRPGGGVQRQNGTCRRWVTVEAKSPCSGLVEPEVVRQLATALRAAADAIEARQ